MTAIKEMLRLFLAATETSGDVPDRDQSLFERFTNET